MSASFPLFYLIWPVKTAAAGRLIGAFPRAVSRMAARGCTYSIYAARRVLTVGGVREKQRPSESSSTVGDVLETQRPSMIGGEEGVPACGELRG